MRHTTPNDALGYPYNDTPITVELTPNLKTEYMLASWLIGGPFHVAWKQWLASLMHLRGEVNGRPPNFQFEGATHELAIYAVHPDVTLTADTSRADMSFIHPATKLETVAIMEPMDVAQQFVADNDAMAMEKVGLVLELVRKGQLSPDQDFREHWKHYLTECTRSDLQVTGGARGQLN